MRIAPRGEGNAQAVVRRQREDCPGVTIVRAERSDDAEAVRRIHRQAFETPAEARLVDLVRASGKLVVSLVAQVDDLAVGHIAFTRVCIAASPQLPGVGLGPMAVLPRMQRHGVGSMLIRAGLGRCRDMGHAYAVVVGHPGYYPRFDFVPAKWSGIQCSWQIPEDVFMALELGEGALAGSGGLATHEPEFYED